MSLPDRSREGGASGAAWAESVARIHAAVAGQSPLNDTFVAIRDVVLRAGPFDRAGVVLYDARRREFRDPLAEGEEAGARPAHVSGCAGGLLASLMDGREAAVVCPPHDGACPLFDEPGVRRSSPRAIAAVRQGEGLIGLLWAECGSSDVGPQEADVAELCAWATVAAGAIRAARLLAERDRRLAIAQKLTRLGAAVAAETDLDDVCRMVRDAVSEAGILDRSAIYLYDPEARVLVGTWGTSRSGEAHGIQSSVLRPDDFPDAPVYRVLFGEVPYVLTEDLTKTLNLSETSPMYGVHAHCAVPLRAGSQVLGVLVGDNLITDRPITDDDIGVLLPFAEQAATAALNARLHAELTRVRDGLRDEVSERTADLEAINAEMAAFVDTLSHDLRSPVRAAEGFTHAVLEEHGSALPPAARRDLERVRDATEKMGKRIEALLAIGRLGRRTPMVSRVPPAEVASQVVADLRSEHRHGAEVVVLPMPSIEADKELIRLLYQELVDNALHATRDAMLARIEIGFADGAFYVKDNGVGFEQEYAHTLFDLFRHYDHGDDAVGAGLAVARRIVDIHSGTIWADGEPGKGATFRFTLGQPRVRRVAKAHTVVSHAPDAGRTSPHKAD